MVATAAVAWFGLVLQFYLTISARMALGDTVASAVVWLLSFFTVLTNTLVAVSLTVLFLAAESGIGKWLATSSVQTGITASIALVGIAYELLLRHLWIPTGPHERHTASGGISLHRPCARRRRPKAGEMASLNSV
jgi:hypothetical protein